MLIEYIDHMGDDLAVVNAARVSFDKESKWLPSGSKTDPDGNNSQIVDGKPVVLSKKDQSLIQFLARGCTSGDWQGFLSLIDVYACPDSFGFDQKDVPDLLNYIRKMPSHWSPFAHTAIKVRMKMPIFVARQVMKHTTGIEYNEVSRRYVDSDPEFYVPDVWRKAADNVKQGSSAEDSKYGTIKDYMDTVKFQYTTMLEYGVAPEQARMVLPQSMYTEVIATGNLYAWANMYNQRTDSHAQKETRDLVLQLGPIMEGLFPVSWKELTE